MNAYRGTYTDPTRAMLERHSSRLARIREDEAHRKREQALSGLSPATRRQIEREEQAQVLHAYKENQRRTAENRERLRAMQQDPHGFAWLNTTDEEEE